MDQTSLITLLGAVGTISGVLFGYLGYKKGLMKDAYGEGNNDAALRSDTQYIKRRIDDVLLEQKDTNKSINALAERVTRVEESSKQAHKRIDRIERPGNES
jgi:hypothetical protein